MSFERVDYGAFSVDHFAALPALQASSMHNFTRWPANCRPGPRRKNNCTRVRSSRENSESIDNKFILHF